MCDLGGILAWCRKAMPSERALPARIRGRSLQPLSRSSTVAIGK